MRTLSAFVLVVCLFVTTSMALPPCETDGCRTQTQGGWGNNCNGNNPGCYRDTHFPVVFPGGLTIGGTHTIHFTNSNAVRIFLPAGGTPGSLTQDHTNPTNTEAGVFAGQVAALAISLGFSQAGLEGFCDLGSLYFLCINLDDEPCDENPFAGKSVDELFELANEVLGGDLSGLPAGTSISNLNDVISTINENFVDGTQDHGNLVCDIRLAAELSSFDGVARDGAIELNWSTASENDVRRFEVERAIGSSWGLIGVVDGLGDSPVGHSYRFVDENITGGNMYSYRLAEVTWDGNRSLLSQIVTVEAGIESAAPAEFALLQNYPNPFNPTTQISFSIPEASRVTLTVFDALGRNVATLMSGSMSAGTHSINFDASELSAGIYFYQLQAGDFSAVRKLLLVK